MSNLFIADQLDRSIEVLLAQPEGESPAVDDKATDQSMRELLEIASQLRSLPRPQFKAQLKADLLERALTAPAIPVDVARIAQPALDLEKPNVVTPQLEKRRNGAPAHTDILPTLFGVGYGNYPVRRGNFALSLLAHAAALALAVVAGIWMMGSHANVSHSIDLTSTEVSLYIPPEVLRGHGGGGGGTHDKMNASNGALPLAARAQLTPPMVVVPNQEPKIPAPPTVVAPAMPPKSLPLGDPLASLAAPPSNGPGSDGGIGAGNAGGVGVGNGPGVGHGWGGGAGGGPYRFGGGVSAPRAIYDPDPEYSEEARKAKYQGVVVLWVVVGADGSAKDIHVSRSLGMGLDEKAIEAVRRWRFEPGMKDGRPVAVQLNIEVTFHLY
jgi:TonB family protein